MKRTSEKARAMIETLRARGLRMTAQRIALVETFASDPTHPTAQELFERLRPSFPSMSFATVYNTLDVLAHAGLSSTLELGGAARFDPNATPHHHAVCDVCGAIADVPAKALAPEARDAERVHDAAPGFTLARVEKTFRGTCAACTRSKRKKEN
ncbi:MAG TPA: Fur family transcriptional regulator [Polyangiaceae bacterium]|jgi:Fur family peroxide stress response transcriptional regulator